MYNSHRIMSDYLADLAALNTYGCAPMSVADLMEEFEVFPVTDDNFDDFVKI